MGVTDSQWIGSLIDRLDAYVMADYEYPHPDDARCHQIQDAIYERALRMIGDNGDDNPVLTALEALRLKDIDFSRWYS